MSNPYALLTDLPIYGLPASALGALTSTQQQAALDTAAGTVDEHIAGRYTMPLQPPIPLIFTELTCVIATWRLMQVRGMDPSSPDYKAFRDRYLDAMGTLGKIQRQALHPIVNQSATAPAEGAQPTVLSQSVVSMSNGATAPNRGW